MTLGSEMSEMDPLGTILGAFANYFTTPFLASALIIGYLIFFLFFYGTEYWNSVDWSERFFFGFMVGMFSMIVCTLVSIPLAFLLFSLQLENCHTDNLFSSRSLLDVSDHSPHGPRRSTEQQTNK